MESLPTSKRQVVIFLDIDGVILPFGYADKGKRVFPSYTLKALSHVLQQMPSAQLVLSSTWRVQSSFVDVIRQEFCAFGGCLGEVDFADYTDPTLHSERQHEIYEWLSRHDEKAMAWIALDDEELLIGDVNQRYRHMFEGHVVKTDSHVGMTMKDANQATELLQQQMNI